MCDGIPHITAFCRVCHTHLQSVAPSCLLAHFLCPPSFAHCFKFFHFVQQYPANRFFICVPLDVENRRELKFHCSCNAVHADFFQSVTDTEHFARSHPCVNVLVADAALEANDSFCSGFACDTGSFRKSALCQHWYCWNVWAERLTS